MRKQGSKGDREHRSNSGDRKGEWEDGMNREREDENKGGTEERR